MFLICMVGHLGEGSYAVRFFVLLFVFNSFRNRLFPLSLRKLKATFVLLIWVSVHFMLSGLIEWQIMFFMSLGDIESERTRTVLGETRAVVFFVAVL